MRYLFYFYFFIYFLKLSLDTIKQNEKISEGEMNCGDVCPVPMRDIPQLPVEPRPNILLLLLLYTHECAYNHHLLAWETGGVLTESTWNDLTFLFFLLRKKKRG